jgi:hypothetical protein
VKDMEHSGLLRPTTQPVALPWDERPTPVRRLGVLIAALILIGTVAGGLLYQHLWEDVGHEITRILPASTTAFVRLSDPLKHLEEARTLDRWADPDTLHERWRNLGLLSGAPNVEIAGVPLATISAMLEDLKTLEYASIPTPSGNTTLLFAHFNTSGAPRSLMRAFGDRIEVIDRLLGFDIFRINAAPAWLPWGSPRDPVHATLMDDRWVLSIGPLEALEDLIEARVGGSSRPIRRRAGFDALSVERDRTGFWAHLDEGIVFDKAREMFQRLEDLPLAYRIALSEAIHGITIRSGIQHGDDSLELRLQLAPSVPSPWHNLRSRVTTAGSHSLLRRMPIAPSSVWSLSVEGAQPLMEIVDAIMTFERAARAGTEDPRTRSRGDWTEGLSVFTTVLGERDALTGDALLASGSTELAEKNSVPVEWAFVLGVRDEMRVRDSLSNVSDHLVAQGWTCGSIHGMPTDLHIVHRGSTSWYWRLSGDVIVASASERMLDLVGNWHGDQSAGGDESTLLRAFRNLPTDSPFLFMLDPKRYRHHVAPTSTHASASGPPPWHELLTLDLRADFRFAAALQFGDDGLSMYTNLGFWTSLAELAAASLDTLETRMIADLLPECRSAYGTMCAALDGSPLCATFLPGRSRVVARACARLKKRGLLQSDESVLNTKP